MKKAIVPCIMCVLLIMLSCNVGIVFALPNEKLEFCYKNKIFTYSLQNNIKQNPQFDLNFSLNQNNRFKTTAERQQLLQHLLHIGIEPEIAVYYIFPNLNKTIKTIEKSVFVPPQNAIIKLNTNSEKVFYITPEVVGIKLNKQQLFNDICSKFLNGKNLTFNLPVCQTEPKINKQTFEKFTNLRADFSTDISNSSTDRKHNIKNAMASLNKVEILPNNVFSFNNIVGRRTTQNGYRQAKIIINNEFVDGIGGGVCQVSSTLYNSALLAGLEIIEANKHSKQVGYVKQGFDAMVNFGSSDLKFKNNTTEKLTIITNYSNNKIRIRIFGEKTDAVYKLSNEIFDILEPTEEVLIDTENKYTDKVIYEDEFFYLKKANKGMTIKSYREKFVDNVLVSKELLRTDKYIVQNAVKVYGSKPKVPTLFDLQEQCSFDMLLQN